MKFSHLKRQISSVYIIPFIPFLFLKSELFGKPSELMYVASTLEKIFKTHVIAIDIGDGTQSLPLEHFFHSTYQHMPQQAHIILLADELNIPSNFFRVIKDSKGVVFVLNAMAMKKILADCQTMPSRAERWLKKLVG